MKFIARMIAVIGHYFFPRRLFHGINAFCIYVKSYYISSFLREVGSNVIFCAHTKCTGAGYMVFGSHVCIGERCSISAWKESESPNPELEIGNNVNIGDDCHITAVNHISIGENTLIGKKVTISDNSHGTNDSLEELNEPPVKRKLYSKGPVFIGANVWIGDKATILPNVSIGRGSIIGANAVVSKDVPEFSVAVGNPARIFSKYNIL